MVLCEIGIRESATIGPETTRGNKQFIVLLVHYSESVRIDGGGIDNSIRLADPVTCSVNDVYRHDIGIYKEKKKGDFSPFKVF